MSNKCTVYICDINYDARSLYKVLNSYKTTPAQAQIAQDEYDSLRSNLAIQIDGLSKWNTHKRVLSDWTLPYMIKDEIKRMTGWNVISFDISAIDVNGNMKEYDQDLTFKFRVGTNNYMKDDNTTDDEEVDNPDVESIED